VVRTGLLLAIAAASSGCFTARYLTQAAVGEYALLHDARPIGQVVKDPAVPRRTRQLLSQVPAIKSWGQSRGLKPTSNYTRYTDLHRPAAVWVVQACSPLAFEPRRWHFPIVGSVPYLGFFDAKEAQAYAQTLEPDDLDVWVRGAAAFSTLGWFRDPVLSPMLSEGDDALGDLINVILHESVHATLYVPGQSSFNESAASFVADAMTEELLVESFGPGGWQTRAWLAAEADGRKRVERLHQVTQELDTLYRSDAPESHKRARKAVILANLKAELGLRRIPNNAMLAGFLTYSAGSAAFPRLKAACGSWPRTLEALSALEPRDFAQPQQEALDAVLDALAARKCGP